VVSLVQFLRWLVTAKRRDASITGASLHPHAQVTECNGRDGEGKTWTSYDATALPDCQLLFATEKAKIEELLGIIRQTPFLSNEAHETWLTERVLRRFLIAVSNRGRYYSHCITANINYTIARKSLQSLPSDIHAPSVTTLSPTMVQTTEEL